LARSRRRRWTLKQAAEDDVEPYGKYDASSPIIASAKGKPNSYAKVNLAHLQDIKIIQMPELVRLVRELTGQIPQIKKLRGALGQFSSGGRCDKTRPADLRGSVAAAKTLAHEIGHLIDYLRHQTMKRGNLLGRLHSLRQFSRISLARPAVTNKELRDELLGSLAGEAIRSGKNAGVVREVPRSGSELYARRRAYLAFLLRVSACVSSRCDRIATPRRDKRPRWRPHRAREHFAVFTNHAAFLPDRMLPPASDPEQFVAELLVVTRPGQTYS